MKEVATTERLRKAKGKKQKAEGGSATPSALASFLLAALLLVACGQQDRGAHTAIRGEPAIQATVLTVQTTIQPENKTFVHSIVIADNRVRSGDEVDHWRLYDLNDKVVTYVDDVAKTYKRQPFADVLAEFRTALAQPTPAGIPHAMLVKTGAHRTIQGVDAEEIQVRAGSYVRQMWIAKHPLIPENLFAIMTASAPSRSPLLPMMRSVDEVLLTMDGFPLADHAELGFDANKKLVVDNAVVKIEKRNVPESWLNASGAYKDVTPPPPAPRERSSRRKK